MSAPRPCRPADMDELAALMAGPGPVHPVAGATDLLIAGRALPEGGVLVDLSAPPDLRGIGTAAADIRIGAATPVAALETHAGLAERFAALAQAAAACGAVQIRNRATIGGNIANAAPSADLVVPLALTDTRLAVIVPGGHWREIALCDYRPGAGVLIVAVVLPGAGLRPASAFVKLGPRRDLTIARLSLAAMADTGRGRLDDLAVVAGALGPRPIRLERAGAALAGRAPDRASLAGFLDALTAEVDAAIPDRPSRAWKRRAIRGLGLDLVARLMGLSPRDALFDGVV